MRNAYRLILGFGIIALTLLSLQIANTKQTTVGKPPLTDNILRSKIAFAVVGEEINRGLNLHTLSESDHYKLRGPVLLEQQTDIHFLLREEFDRIVNTVYFGAALDAGSPSQNPSIRPENKPVLYQKAAEIIRDFIAERHISVIIRSHAPIGIGEMAAIHRLQGEVRYTYEIINSAAVSVPLKNIAALIKLPFITEIWPDSKGRLALADSIPQIGADKVHKPPPNGLGVTGKGVIVAVVDDGIYNTHDAITKDRITDERGPWVTDGQPENHGTAVASVIGANDVQKAKIGVAPEVHFLDATYANWFKSREDTATDSGIETQGNAGAYGEVMDAIRWAAGDRRLIIDDAAHKAHVVNISLGWSPVKYGRRGLDPMSCLIDTEVERYGVVVVVSAGNEATWRASGKFLSGHPSGIRSGNVPYNTHDFDSKEQDEVTITLSWDKKSSNNNDLDLVVDTKPANYGGVSDTVSGNGTDCETETVSNYEQVKIPVSPNTVYTVEVTGPVLHSDQDYEVWLEPGDDTVKSPEFLHPNEEKTVMVPGYSEKAITVGAVDNFNVSTFYSSQGPSDTGLIKPEVVAPGNIEVAIPPPAEVAPGPGNDYKYHMGTSLAAPHVSGVAALILDAVGKNSAGEWNFSPDEVKSAIVRGAKRGFTIPQEPDNEYGAGLVRADNIIFGDVVQPGATKRFRITPALLGYNFPAGYLNAENKYPNRTSSHVDFSVAISWGNNGEVFPLAPTPGTTIPPTQAAQPLELKLLNTHLKTIVESSGVSNQYIQGSNYVKITDVDLSIGLSPNDFLHLDVYNPKGNAPIRFTGASTQPIWLIYDINRDGQVDKSDVAIIEDIMEHGDTFEAGGFNAAADVNGDGRVTAEDKRLIEEAIRVVPILSKVRPTNTTTTVPPQGISVLNLPEDAKARFGKGNIHHIAYSPDGSLLATAGRAGVWLYDAKTYQAVGFLRGNKYGVSTLAFSPDGKTLATGNRLYGTANTVRLWDVATRTEKHTLTTGSVYGVAFSPDGKTIATTEDRDLVRLWDVDTGTEKNPVPTGSVKRIAFSPDGKTIATAGGGGLVRLWSVSFGVEMKVFTGYNGGINSIAFSPDGKTIAGGGSDNTVRLWDVDTGETKHRLRGHTREVKSIKFSPDGKTLATGSSDNTVRLWDIETGETKHTLTGDTVLAWNTFQYPDVTFSSDGKTIASVDLDFTVLLWDVETGTQKKTLTGHTSEVHSVAFSPDGQTLASGVMDQTDKKITVRLWDVETRTEKKTLTGHVYLVHGVAFSPDGKTIATAGNDNTVRLWDAATGAEKKTLTGHRFWVYSVAFSPDGKILTSGGSGNTYNSAGTVHLWNVETGESTHTLAHHWGSVHSVAFSPDGKTIAGGGVRPRGGGVYLWDVETGENTHTVGIPGHSIAFSPDGKTIAGGGGGGANLWNLAFDEIKQTFPLPTHSYYGRLAVYSVVFSPDGNTLATGGETATGGGTVVLWDVKTGESKHTLTGHTAPVRSIAFNLDGDTLASGSEDGTVLLWDVTPYTVEPPAPEYPAWDVNRDGQVNIVDVVSVSHYIGEPASASPRADVNGDGIINILDLLLVSKHIGESTDAAAPAIIAKLEGLDRTTVEGWLALARIEDDGSLMFQQGIAYLERLLAALTPKETALLPNYPNPFNPETWIPYQLATPAEVSLTIYDIQGRVVRTLDLGHQRPGMYQSKSRAAYWDGRNAVGEPVASGVYFYTLTAGDFTATRKLLIQK